MLKLANRDFIQTNSQATPARDLYSALVEEREMMVYFFDFQLIKDLPMNTQ